MILDYFSCNISSESLDQLIADDDLTILAKEITLSKDTILGLTQQEREEACRGCSSRRTTQLQIMERWKKKKAECSTYNNLIEDACKYHQVGVAKKIREILLRGVIFENETMETFHEDLLDRYTRKSHPSNTQWPGFQHKYYVDQVLELNIGGEKVNVPLTLQKIFNGNTQSSRRVILIEGVAGSGKTTLLWHICKQWALGKLFNQFRLMIHISLSNPDLEDAKYLADIIPSLDKNVQRTVAEHIISSKGRNMCFVLDGYDEIPDSLWKDRLLKGVLGKFLQDETMLPQCTLLITSRSSSKLSQYHIPHDKRILLRGCVPDDIFKTLLQDDVEKMKKIESLLEMNPNLHALCSLPINAIILIFIHEMVNEENMPRTRTDLFNLMLCNFIVRHLQTRTKHTERSIENLDDLPPDIKSTLNELCLLAYNASISGRRKMKYCELEELGMQKPDENFGLLEILNDKTVRGSDLYYSFPHLSIQEFLAALHVKSMGDEEEALVIKKFLDKDPLNPIIPFHAGLTKLKNMKIRNLHLTLNGFTYTSKNNEIFGSFKAWLVVLFNCIYECQNDELIQLFDPREHHLIHLNVLSFNYITLHPSDCLSLGYFARIKSQTIEKQQDMLRIGMVHCSMNAPCIEALAREMKRGLSSNCRPRVGLVFNHFDYTSDRGRTSIKTLIEGPFNILARLKLPSSNTENIPAVLKSIIEGLDNSSSLQELSISYWGINSTHIHHLILLMYIKSNLASLDLSGNDLGGAIPLLSEVVRVTKRLRSLVLSSCNIDDRGLNYLGKALAVQSFFTLVIDHNSLLTAAGMNKFLFKISILSLSTLITDENLLDERNKMVIERMNQQRKYYYIPPLQINESQLTNMRERLIARLKETREKEKSSI